MGPFRRAGTAGHVVAGDVVQACEHVATWSKDFTVPQLRAAVLALLAIQAGRDLTPAECETVGCLVVEWDNGTIG
jgi:hypothetical protein